MPILLQLAQSYNNPDDINYKVAYLKELLEQQLLNLGDLAYADQVQLAMLGETIIEGGYLRTELIRAKSIFANHLNIDALSSISANIGEITSGTITGATVRTSSGANRIQLTNSVLQAYLNNVKRVELDYDSLDFYNSQNIQVGSLLGSFYENLHSMIMYSNRRVGIIASTEFTPGTNENPENGAAVVVNSDYDGFAPSAYIEAGIDRDTNYAALGVGDNGSGYFYGNDFSVFGAFNVYGSKSAIVDTKDYGLRKMYALEAPENRFITYIEKTLEIGEHYIEIEPMFRQTISNYFVVPHIQNNAVVSILEKDDNGFKVLVEGKQAEVVFEVNGKRIGYENVYMEEVEHGTLEYKSDEKSVIKPADIFRQSRLQRLKGSRSSIGADISIY